MYLSEIHKVSDPRNTAADVQEIYTTWADKYDKDITAAGGHSYHGLEMVACQLHNVVKNRDAKILEIGSGTGLLGLELAKKGYVHIDGIDPCHAMVERARKLNVYKQIYVNFVGKNRLCIPENTYDGVVGCAVFVPGHITWEAFPELQRITKHGGVVIISCSERYFDEKYLDYGKTLEGEIQKHERNGAWKCESRSWQPFYGPLKALVCVLRVN